MKKCPSWEAKIFSTSQEISYILWTKILITTFKTARQLRSVSWARYSQSTFSNHISWRPHFILSSHLHPSSKCLWNTDLLQTKSIVQHEVTGSTKVRVKSAKYYPREGSDDRVSARTFSCSAQTTIIGRLFLHLRFSWRCYSDVGSAGQTLSKERKSFTFTVGHCKTHLVQLEPFEERTTVVRNVGQYSPIGTASRPTKKDCNTKRYEHVFAVHDKIQLYTNVHDCTHLEMCAAVGQGGVV